MKSSGQVHFQMNLRAVGEYGAGVGVNWWDMTQGQEIEKTVSNNTTPLGIGLSETDSYGCAPYTSAEVLLCAYSANAPPAATAGTHSWLVEATDGVRGMYQNFSVAFGVNNTDVWVDLRPLCAEAGQDIDIRYTNATDVVQTNARSFNLNRRLFYGYL